MLASRPVSRAVLTPCSCRVILSTSLGRPHAFDIPL